jgi:ribosomal protein S25
LLELAQQYRQRVAGTSHSANAVRLIDEILAAPFITVNGAAAALKVTFPTAQNAIKRLVAAGILQEVTGQKRNRVYRAQEILTLLDDAPPEGGAGSPSPEDGVDATGDDS